MIEHTMKQTDEQYEQIAKRDFERRIYAECDTEDKRAGKYIEEPKTITQCECLRCKGKPWWPRKGEPSFRCPHCHSKYWNVPPRPGKLRRGFVEQGLSA